MSCFKRTCLSCPSEKGGWSHSVLSESWLSANQTHEDPRGEGLHLPCALLVSPCCILCSTPQFCNVCYRLRLTSRVCPEHLLYSASLLLLFIGHESTPLNFGSCDFLTLECQSTTSSPTPTVSSHPCRTVGLPFVPTVFIHSLTRGKQCFCIYSLLC